MPQNFGVPELAILMVIGMFWLVPVAAGAWALWTLYRMRTSLERIEALLQRR